MKKSILAILLLSAFAIGIYAQSEKTVKNFKMTGVWRLVKTEDPSGEVTDITNYKQMREYKILCDDYSYYCIDIYYNAKDERFVPHEKATYSYKDGVYVENGRSTSMKVVDYRTFSMVWNNVTQYYQRVDLPLEEVVFLKNLISTSTLDALAHPVKTIARFSGGDPMLYDFIKKNLSNEKDIKGTVWVEMTIMKDGTKKGIIVKKGISPEADAEALRVVNIMPNWIPATNNGQAEDMKITVPIPFDL
jgi:TonB family protein